MEIKYSQKNATENEIFTHLEECDAEFFPPLSERIEPEKYAHKIFDKALTFEAWHENILVGLVAVYINNSANPPSAFITNVSVIKKYYGSGIASELLGNCIAYVKKEHISEIKLEVNIKSISAISFYKKYDFIKDGEKNGFLMMKLNQ